MNSNLVDPPPMTPVAVVIVAAGRGARAGSGEAPKQYRNVAGIPVLALTVDAFLHHPRTGKVIVVIHPADVDLAALALDGREVDIVHGSTTRQRSARLGLQALEGFAPEKVLIHDAARPFADGALIDRVINAVGPRNGALPALPVSDTLKRMVGEESVIETVDRGKMFAAQTPQGFPFRLIADAHEAAAALNDGAFTDDSSIAEWAAIPMRIVEGSMENVKLTWQRDFDMAEQRFSRTPSFPDVRVGNGYDVHAFETGSFVTLCGVAIPFHKSLSGHSDADVGLHALTDALLATCGAGDIGTHFPPSDPQWRGAASLIFVARAVEIVRSAGGRISNADITLICEEPRIAPYRGPMVDAVALMLGVAKPRVSIKATTNERLGFIGRGEGIAAIANASIVFPGGLPDE